MTTIVVYGISVPKGDPDDVRALKLLQGQQREIYSWYEDTQRAVVYPTDSYWNKRLRAFAGALTAPFVYGKVELEIA